MFGNACLKFVFAGWKPLAGLARTLEGGRNPSATLRVWHCHKLPNPAATCVSVSRTQKHETSGVFIATLCEMNQLVAINVRSYPTLVPTAMPARHTRPSLTYHKSGWSEWRNTPEKSPPECPSPWCCQ